MDDRERLIDLLAERYPEHGREFATYLADNHPDSATVAHARLTLAVRDLGRAIRDALPKRLRRHLD